MSSPTTQWLMPSRALNPAAPADRASVAPVSRWSLGPIPTVLAFPSRIDETRLRTAVEVVAGWWPNVAGRYERVVGTPNEYYIRFTRSPIPFSVHSLDRETAYDTREVVQDTHAPYISPLSPAHLYPGDEPLISVRLTHLRAGSGSVIGILWSHLLGDAAAAHHFIRHVAFLYATPDAAPPDPPTFGDHVRTPPVTPEMRDRFALHQLKVWKAADAFNAYARTKAAVERVTWRLGPADVEGIRRDAKREEDEVMSTQDMISAWWASLIARAGHTVDRVVYTINYRGFHPSVFPPDLRTLSANVTQMRAVPLAASAPRDTAYISRAIRAAINDLRGDVAQTAAWIAYAGEQIGRAADEDGMLVVLPLDDEVVVNSNLRCVTAGDPAPVSVPVSEETMADSRYAWAIPFDGVTPDHHTTDALPRFLRVFQANGSGEPELVFCVDTGTRATYDALLAADRARWAAGADA
ncbi:hypothetical protein Q5752_001466 [Cryptotrichosporon argae]